jgi:hypothetical protein
MRKSHILQNHRGRLVVIFPAETRNLCEGDQLLVCCEGDILKGKV